MELHLIGAENLGTQLCYNLTIDCNNSCLDELISLTARAYTCIGKELVQTQWLCWIEVLLLVLDTLLQAILSIWIVSWSVLTIATLWTTVATTVVVVATLLTTIATTTIVVVATLLT